MVNFLGLDRLELGAELILKDTPKPNTFVHGLPARAFDDFDMRCLDRVAEIANIISVILINHDFQPILETSENCRIFVLPRVFLVTNGFENIGRVVVEKSILVFIENGTLARRLPLSLYNLKIHAFLASRNANTLVIDGLVGEQHESFFNLFFVLDFAPVDHLADPGFDRLQSLVEGLLTLHPEEFDKFKPSLPLRLFHLSL